MYIQRDLFIKQINKTSQKNKFVFVHIHIFKRLQSGNAEWLNTKRVNYKI